MYYRNQWLTLDKQGDSYMVGDFNGNNIFKPEDDFYIYFRNVRFFENGKIEGVFLGDVDKIMDNQFNHKDAQAVYKGDGYYYQEDKIERARLVGIKNKTGVVIMFKD